MTVTEGEPPAVPSFQVRSPTLLVYTLPAVVLVPRDRARRALQLEKDVTDAVSKFKRMNSSTPYRSRWELPFCLRNLAVETDCDRLLEILDISVAQGNSKIWKGAIEILSRFKPITEIGTARVVASVNKFSFAELKHLWVPQAGGSRNITDLLVALVRSMHG